MKIKQPDIKLTRHIEADQNITLVETNKRELRRVPRRKYGLWPFHEDDILMPGEEDPDDIQDGNYEPKDRRGRSSCTSCPLESAISSIVKHNCRCTSNEPDLDPDVYHCVICSPISEWPDMTAYINHSQKHKVNDVFTCPLCSHRHPTFKEISDHIVKVHLNGRKNNLKAATVEIVTRAQNSKLKLELVLY